MSQSKAKEARHLKKLFDGRTTARELWRQTVLGNKFCGRCHTARAVGMIDMFCPAPDFEAKFPRLAVKYAMENSGRIPYVQFKSSGEIRNYVVLPTVFFCAACQGEVEKWAARKPSYVVSHVRTGPAADTVSGQVPA